MTDITLTPLMVGLVPIVIALAQVVKVYVLDSKWIPLSALILGVLGAYLVTKGVSADATLQGILVGLAAIGAFSGVRGTFAS